MNWDSTGEAWWDVGHAMRICDNRAVVTKPMEKQNVILVGLLPVALGLQINWPVMPCWFFAVQVSKAQHLVGWLV